MLPIEKFDLMGQNNNQIPRRAGHARRSGRSRHAGLSGRVGQFLIPFTVG